MALGDNLVSYWKLDESSGNAADATPTGNTLTNNNVVSYASAVINNGAFMARASHQCLSITNASQTGLNITGDMTVAGWVNYASLPGSGMEYPFAVKIFGGSANNRQYNYTFKNNAGTLQLQAGLNPTSSGSGGFTILKTVDWTPSTSTWYHIAYVFTNSAGSVDFYVNGAQQGTTQTGYGSGIFSGDSTFLLGSDDPTDENIDGAIDEVGVWSRSLSSSEINQLYNGGIGLTYPFAGGGQFIPRLALSRVG